MFLKDISFLRKLIFKVISKQISDLQFPNIRNVPLLFYKIVFYFSEDLWFSDVNNFILYFCSQLLLNQLFVLINMENFS